MSVQAVMAAGACAVAPVALSGPLGRRQAGASGGVAHSLRSTARPALPSLRVSPGRHRQATQSKYLGNAEKAGQQAGESASKAGHQAGHAAQKAGHAAENVASQAQDTLQGAGARAKEATGASEGNALSLILCVALPVIIGAVISNSNNSSSSEWYQGLNKPSWTPPDWLFGIAWSVLYAVVGYSGYLVFQKGGIDAQAGPLTNFAVQLGLNFMWPIVCFGGKNLLLALVNIVALAISIYLTIKAFAPVDEFAAKLLWPYLAWVVFAGALNYNLWRNNRNTPPGTTVRAGYS